MAQYIGVSFKRHGQVYFFLATPFVLGVHDKVLVKTDEGIGYGEVVVAKDTLPEHLDGEHLKPVYRPATQDDELTCAENTVLAREGRIFCQRCIDRLRLDMKLVDVEVYFDRSKMIFYFTSPGRVDFRELVKDLVRNYRTRIELRQIGVRHETQMLGAMGNCGQVCCCRRYLRRFDPVTIKMAKDQNLFLNPAKISGACGRLLCCLSYEKDTYADFQQRAPRTGRKYRTSQGVMKTLRVNMFEDTVSVLTETGDELDFPLGEFNAILIPGNEHAADTSQTRTSEKVSQELEALEDPEVQPQRSGKNSPRRSERGRANPKNQPPQGKKIHADAQKQKNTPTERKPRPDQKEQRRRPRRKERTGKSNAAEAPEGKGA